MRWEGVSDVHASWNYPARSPDRHSRVVDRAAGPGLDDSGGQVSDGRGHEARSWLGPGPGGISYAAGERLVAARYVALYQQHARARFAVRFWHLTGGHAPP